MIICSVVKYRIPVPTLGTTVSQRGYLRFPAWKLEYLHVETPITEAIKADNDVSKKDGDLLVILKDIDITPNDRTSSGIQV